MTTKHKEMLTLRFTGIAAGIINRRRFVKATSTTDFAQCGLGDAAVGVSWNDDAADTQNITVVNGIVIVESGAAVVAGASVQSDANGKAITRTNGAVIGTALSGSGVTGELIAVKFRDANPESTVGSIPHTVSFLQSNLAAGADVAAIPVFVVPAGFKFTVTEMDIISQGAAVGVDDADTALFTINVGATVLATKTFNTSVVFPASGVVSNMGAIANGVRVAGDVITFTNTNGTTADLPAYIMQISGTLEIA